MPFSTALVAAHSGLTERQVRYWSKPQRGWPPLVKPEYRARPALWSFRDLVALRMLARVREGTPLPQIRAAVKAVRKLTGGEHLSAHTLRAAGRTVLWLPDGEGSKVGVDPLTGQQADRILLSDVLGEFDGERGKVLDLTNPYPGVSVDPQVLSGFPVAAGTRVPYDLIAGLVRDGVPPDEVRHYYPSVTEEGARDAERFATYVEEGTGRTRAA